MDAMSHVAECYAEGLGVPATMKLRSICMPLQPKQAMHRRNSSLAECCWMKWMPHKMNRRHGPGCAERHGKVTPGARLALESLDERIRPASAIHVVGSAIWWQRKAKPRKQWIKYVQQHGRARDAFDLAVMYAQGVGVERNMRQARAQYRRAADMGLADGQYQVGLQKQSVDPQWRPLIGSGGCRTGTCSGTVGLG